MSQAALLSSSAGTGKWGQALNHEWNLGTGMENGIRGQAWNDEAELLAMRIPFANQCLFPFTPLLQISACPHLQVPVPICTVERPRLHCFHFRLQLHFVPVPIFWEWNDEAELLAMRIPFAKPCLSPFSDAFISVADSFRACPHFLPIPIFWWEAFNLLASRLWLGTAGGSGGINLGESTFDRL